ncbi:cbb3-type cytochrome c oxidase subunit 3 [Methylobrevis albus]|uniref:Cbb3-type cytochrome c oxidase subunit 3 n=1 Tax=Methylobrevis albus TaxID=2793297 RepID=A0A931MZ65_9HYPH|nr:cbb3-type cytochrome c oxidase subunit 3 [Methylobrevis albus]MBH0238720.1 cbb3-type cytochrome c oxidase subunit 3 [Methylobrevis albus]
MSDTYMMLAHFAQTWGLAYFVGVFLVVLAYALSPSRKGRFDAAARLPLSED